MRPTKKAELELEKARIENDIPGYIKADIRRFELSQFEKYRVKLISAITKNQSLGMTIELGSNIGLLAKIYERKANKIILCDKDDFTLKGAEIVNAQILSKLQFVCADIEDLPFKNDFFDSVFALEVIEHIHKEKHKKVLEEIIRISKKGAKIFISTPNKFSLAGLEGKIIEFFKKNYRWNSWDPAHKYVYASCEFINLIKESNSLKIKKVVGSYFLPGSLLVRLPFIFQKIAGFISYLVALYCGSYFPFKYVGFTTIAICKK